jgi:hypothetical protein
LKVEKIDNVEIFPDDKIKLTTMGNVYEVLRMDRINKKSCILVLDKDSYIDLRTGERKEFEHHENRACDRNELRKTMRRLRGIINANCADVSRCRWITFTYQDNMTDTERLYSDCKKLIKRVRYHLGHFEYIHVVEPQGRGAWHIHALWIFADKAPFIDSAWLRNVWGNGFVTVKKLENVDNVGAYLTAYLCDCEIEDYTRYVFEKNHLSLPDDISVITSQFSGDDILVKEVEQDGKKVSKRLVKGGRMYMYPPNFNLYRASRGIQKPIEEYLTYENAQKKIGSAQPTFSTSIRLTDDVSDFQNVIIKEYYNRLR